MGTKLPPEPKPVILNLSALVYLLGITVITWCITRAAERHPLWKKKTWTTMPWARTCFLLVLLDSWLYLIMTGVLLFGAPHPHGHHRCSIGITLCLICYGASKVLVYLCLIERVRAVWSTKQLRWRSPIYIFCLSLLLPLVGVVAGVMIPQAVHYVYNGYCVIGINRLSFIFLPIYDTCINLFLTGMFVVPLVRATIRCAWLRAVAIRSTIASLITLATTLTNGVIIFVFDGNETIWICLGSCAADIVINAVILYWALQEPRESPNSAYLSPIGNTSAFQSGPLDSVAISQDLSTTSHDPSHQSNYNASDTTVAVSHVRVSSLAKPKPTLQTSLHYECFAQHQSRKRLSLPLATERYLTFRQKPELHSQEVNHPGPPCSTHFGK